MTTPLSVRVEYVQNGDAKCVTCGGALDRNTLVLLTEAPSSSPDAAATAAVAAPHSPPPPHQPSHMGCVLQSRAPGQHVQLAGLDALKPVRRQAQRSAAPVAAG